MYLAEYLHPPSFGQLLVYFMIYHPAKKKTSMEAML